MGIWSWIKGEYLLESAPELERAEPAPDADDSALVAMLAARIAERQSTFSLADALALPPIARAVDLLVSIGSTFQPVEYLDGIAAEEQPRIIRRPDPYMTRQEWLAQTLLSIIEHGEWYWLLGERREGYPDYALVLPHDEVEVSWDDRRFQRRYRWRGRELTHGTDIVHGAVLRRAGELHGRSVLRDALPYLAAIDAAERYARESFGAFGVPTTVLRALADITATEAAKLRADWAEARATSRIAVVPAGVEPSFPDIDPGRMQLAETRSAGATAVARLMGIPGALLLAETSGSSVTYTNVDAVIGQLTKVTIVPRYLSPIEAHLADLVPRTRTVRFGLGELHRADLATRFTIYATAIGAGVLTAPEARTLEGWPAVPASGPAPAFAPTPAPATDPLPLREVPA